MNQQTVDVAVSVMLVADAEYLAPRHQGPMTRVDHPISYITPINVYDCGDLDVRSKEVYPTVVVTADTPADVVEKINRPGW